MSTEILDRRPPADVEAEKAIIGSIFILADVLDDVNLIVSAGDFYDDANATLFRVIRDLREAGSAIDIVTVRAELKRLALFDSIGGSAYLAKVAECVPNAAHAIHYARIVRDKSIFRTLISLATDTLRESYHEEERAETLLQLAEARLFELADRGVKRGGAPVSDVFHAVIEAMEARQEGRSAGLKTGFTQLDELTRGLHPGELIVVAARPSMGKSAFAHNVAEYVSVEQEAAVLYISLEMGAMELAERMACGAARVNSHRVRAGTLSQDDRRKMLDAFGLISNTQLHIDDDPGHTLLTIGATARRMKRRKGLDLIIVDYLQLIEPADNRASREQQVSSVSRGLKRIARQLNVPMIVVAQLNRQAESSSDHRPRLSHLRESGAIEQDADVVLFVHRDEYYAKGEEERQRLAGQAELILAKQRNGPLGIIPLHWRKEFTLFENPAPDRHNEFDSFNERGWTP